MLELNKIHCGDCMECGKEYDSSKRTSEFWKKQYSSMGVCANICNDCWKKEYHIDVSNK